MSLPRSPVGAPRRISRTRLRTLFRITADPRPLPVEMANRSWSSRLGRVRMVTNRWLRLRPLAPRAAKSARARSMWSRPTPMCRERPSDRELPAALRAAGGEHAPSTLRLHPGTEPVLLGAVALLGLIRLLGHRWA